MSSITHRYIGYMYMRVYIHKYVYGVIAMYIWLHPFLIAVYMYEGDFPVDLDHVVVYIFLLLSVAAGTESNQSQKSTSSPSHSPSSPTTLTSITQLTNAVDKTSPTSANQTSISGTSSLPLDSQNTAVHVQTEKVGTKVYFMLNEPRL